LPRQKKTQIQLGNVCGSRCARLTYRKQKLEEHEQEHDVHVEPYIMPVDSSYTNEKNMYGPNCRIPADHRRPPGVFQIDGVERREKAAHNGPFIDAWALE